MRVAIACIAVLCFPACAYAYIGPGVAITLLGSILGFSSLVLLGTISTFAWPIWLVIRYIRRKRAQHKNTSDADSL